MGCSTPEGVIVSITGPSARRSPGPPLLNARRRHRLDHQPGGLAVGSGTICSTPEGVIVSITIVGSIAMAIGNICSTPEGVIVSITPAASATSRARSRCSTPEGVIVSIHQTGLDQGPSPRCSTPEGVIVSITRRTRRSIARHQAAQRPKASSSRSREARAERPCGAGLLNARRRHRLDHASWPGSVGPRRPAQRPKASSSRSPAPAAVGESPLSAAQRPKASSSRSQAAAGHRRPAPACSTPEGVIVSITGLKRSPDAADVSAQRPKASSSRSRLARHAARRRIALLNARRRHRLDQQGLAGLAVEAIPLLNARRRHRLDRGRPSQSPGMLAFCSTPEGVIVSIARAR